MSTDSARVVQGFVPDTGSRRVLLFNPPVYDTRFPWSHWHQPITFLQLATLLRCYECDIRLLDALNTKPNETLTRRRKRVLMRGEIPINYWRFGQPESELEAQLRTWHKEGWQPDEVYLEGFTTIWWEGVDESIKLVRRLFSKARIILCGSYPSFATEHAAMPNGADVLAIGPIEGLAGLPLDLTLYPTRPLFTYLSIGTDKRSSTDLVHEFLMKANLKNEKERITRFAFADHDVIRRFPEQFRAVLREIIDRKIRVSFYALGNISPKDLVDDPELASLLFRAGFKQLVFADDRGQPLTEKAREEHIDDYRYAIERCVDAGYRWRTETVAGSVCVGRPGEQLEDIASYITKLAHVAGSLIVVPYQPVPAECEPNLPLELQNGKLFPFAEHNGVSYRVYQDLLGLAAVLNAKYRSCTFDFLGDGLISRLVRTSLVSKSWDPHNTPNIQNERPVTVGWFNKEGKWVRS
jgi:hypothetical protein